MSTTIGGLVMSQSPYQSQPNPGPEKTVGYLRPTGVDLRSVPIPTDYIRYYPNSDTAPGLIRGPLSDEPLVKIQTLGLQGDNYYWRNGGNPPYNTRIPGSIKGLYVRESVERRLAYANWLLRPYGVELYVLDGLRPTQTQRGIFFFMERQYQKAHPGATDAEARAYALQYASDPEGDISDPNRVLLHGTGGAVDVWLRDLKTGRLLDLGTGFDEADQKSETDYCELELQAGKIGPNDAALRNRRLLYWAMKLAGEENYPEECWHFDYADRMYYKDLAVQGLTAAPGTPQYGYAATPVGA